MENSVPQNRGLRQAVPLRPEDQARHLRIHDHSDVNRFRTTGTSALIDALGCKEYFPGVDARFDAGLTAADGTARPALAAVREHLQPGPQCPGRPARLAGCPGRRAQGAD
jgi:hypothetical protein